MSYSVYLYVFPEDAAAQQVPDRGPVDLAGARSSPPARALLVQAAATAIAIPPSELRLQNARALRVRLQLPFKTLHMQLHGPRSPLASDSLRAVQRRSTRNDWHTAACACARSAARPALQPGRALGPATLCRQHAQVHSVLFFLYQRFHLQFTPFSQGMLPRRCREEYKLLQRISH